MKFSETLKKRPLSWSAISSFQYSPEQWYKKYILGEKERENQAMLFGKKFGKSVEDRKPLAPVEIYEKTEYPLNIVFNNIPLVGYIDTYKPHKAFREYKTTKEIWPEKKVKDHGQLKMYALMLYVQHKVKPEDLTIHLDCIQTQESGDFEIDFIKPFNIKSFPVKLTMIDILNFGLQIKTTVKEMELYAKNHL